MFMTLEAFYFLFYFLFLFSYKKFKLKRCFTKLASFVAILSILVPAAMDGFEPLTLGSRGNCITIVLQPLAPVLVS